jgi:hypothetical protein
VSKARDERLAAVATLVGVVWLPVQILCTWRIVETDENRSYLCTLDLSKTTLGAITILVCVSAVAAAGLVLRRAYRQALIALALEALFIGLWALAGGWGAFDCASGI